MPKHNLNDIAKKQEELQEKLDKANSTAIAGMIIGSLALLITLVHLAVS